MSSFSNEVKYKIFKLSADDFKEYCLEIFQYQSVENEAYKNYLSNLGINKSQIKKVSQIPFLPISFFKKHKVICGNQKADFYFESSGTTGSEKSRHFINDLDFYREVSIKIFEKSYGNLSDYKILALLPSYLERKNASLVFMVKQFIKKAHKDSGFYLDEWDKLEEVINYSNQKMLLLGVTFALLDFSEKKSVSNSLLTIMETGGMKGRKEEMIRQEVHQKLKSSFNAKQIHSEYGMTELLSQSYAPNYGIFIPPAWKKVLIRQTNDPFSLAEYSNAGVIKVIDLANIDSCCFIETQDLGRIVNPTTGSFEVLGRMDNSEMRGCNLMI